MVDVPAWLTLTCVEKQHTAEKVSYLELIQPKLGCSLATFPGLVTPAFVVGWGESFQRSK